MDFISKKSIPTEGIPSITTSHYDNIEHLDFAQFELINAATKRVHRLSGDILSALKNYDLNRTRHSVIDIDANTLDMLNVFVDFIDKTYSNLANAKSDTDVFAKAEADVDDLAKADVDDLAKADVDDLAKADAEINYDLPPDDHPPDDHPPEWYIDCTYHQAVYDGLIDPEKLFAIDWNGEDDQYYKVIADGRLDSDKVSLEMWKKDSENFILRHCCEHEWQPDYCSCLWS